MKEKSEKLNFNVARTFLNYTVAILISYQNNSVLIVKKFCLYVNYNLVETIGSLFYRNSYMGTCQNSACDKTVNCQHKLMTTPTYQRSTSSGDLAFINETKKKTIYIYI